jgi:AcrR family transcriptional regulator
MPAPAPTGRPARPGRPRADLDTAIRDATLGLLAADGYQRLTMGAVADAAGIGKPTLYRRYASKSVLVAAVLVGLADGETRPVLPPDTREALVLLLASTGRALAAPGSMTILGSLLAQSREDPELIAAFREAVFRPQTAVVHAMIEAGILRGDVRPGMDLEAIDAMLFGALLARSILGQPATGDWATRVVAAAWPAIAMHSPIRTEII